MKTCLNLLVTLATVLVFSSVVSAGGRSGKWVFDTSAVGPSEVVRVATTSNDQGETLKLSHYLNSGERFAVFTLPKEEFSVFAPAHGLLFRVDGGEVLRADEYSSILQTLTFGLHEVKIGFYFKDRVLTNPDSKVLQIRWVDDTGEEHISVFKLNGYEQAIKYVKRDPKEYSAMFDDLF